MGKELGVAASRGSRGRRAGGAHCTRRCWGARPRLAAVQWSAVSIRVRRGAGAGGRARGGPNARARPAPVRLRRERATPASAAATSHTRALGDHDSPWPVRRLAKRPPSCYVKARCCARSWSPGALTVTYQNFISNFLKIIKTLSSMRPWKLSSAGEYLFTLKSRGRHTHGSAVVSRSWRVVRGARFGRAAVAAVRPSPLWAQYEVRGCRSRGPPLATHHGSRVTWRPPAASSRGAPPPGAFSRPSPLLLRDGSDPMTHWTRAATIARIELVEKWGLTPVLRPRQECPRAQEDGGEQRYVSVRVSNAAVVGTGRQRP